MKIQDDDFRPIMRDVEGSQEDQVSILEESAWRNSSVMLGITKQMDVVTKQCLLSPFSPLPILALRKLHLVSVTADFMLYGQIKGQSS